MRPCRSLAILALAVNGLCLSVAQGQDRSSPELHKLYALVVVDINSGLGESVVIDGNRVEEALRHGIGSDRLSVTRLTGKDVTPKGILGYYQSLRGKVTREDALFFYYCGHGAIDVDRGHFLYLQEGKGGNFYRSELRQAMLKPNAGLTVIVTDCCSEKMKLKAKHKTRASPDPLHDDAKPIFRNLFFQHRGLVDITAATDNCSWGDDHQGGLFTRNFGKVLANSRIQDVDDNHDGFVSWKEFFNKVQGLTQKTFSVWAPKARSEGEKIEQTSQKPHAFALSEGGMPAVTLLNERIQPLRYQFRWAGESSWSNATIPAGDARVHVPARGARAPSKLEVMIDGDSPQLLEPGRTYRETGKK